MRLRILIFSLGSLSMSLLYGQTYQPLPDSAAIWVNSTLQYQNFPVPHCEFVYATNYCVNGQDTIVNSTNYTKLEICDLGDYKGAFRNDNGKVYYVPVDSTQEYLLYDFTADVGDTIPDVWPHILSGEVIVEYVDSIQVYGEYLKRLHIKDGAQWIEKIGNTRGILAETLDNISGWCFELTCMSHNDSTFYPGESLESCYLGIGLDDFGTSKEIVVYPNPTKNLLYVASSENDVDRIKIYSSYGVLLEEIYLGNNNQIDMKNYTVGVYFIEFFGKKSSTVKKIIKN